jgi:hypothetical protein
MLTTITADNEALGNDDGSLWTAYKLHASARGENDSFTVTRSFYNPILG